MPRSEAHDQQPPMRPGQHLAARGTQLGVLAQVGDDLVQAREQRVVVGSHARQYAHASDGWLPRFATVLARPRDLRTLPVRMVDGHPDRSRA